MAITPGVVFAAVGIAFGGVVNGYSTRAVSVYGFMGLFLVACSSMVLAGSFENALVAAAVERTQHTVTYDGTYHAIDYPGGDVPAGIGVCTDVVIRAYRAVGVDLQEEVHEDIAAHFDRYPSRRIWGLSGPDTNIDHRRVPNLQVFFERNGESLPVTGNASDYKPGDIVTWMLAGNLPHIGIVTDQTSADGKRPLVVHNIGAGPRLEDVLFAFRITGHYRYAPGEQNMTGSRP